MATSWSTTRLPLSGRRPCGETGAATQIFPTLAGSGNRQINRVLRTMATDQVKNAPQVDAKQGRLGAIVAP